MEAPLYYTPNRSAKSSDYRDRARVTSVSQSYLVRHAAKRVSLLRLITTGTLEQRLPPRLMVDVPLNRRFQAFLEILARLPFQFLLGKRRIDRIAAIVPEAVFDE